MLETDKVIGELNHTVDHNLMAQEINQNTPPGAVTMYAGAAAPTGWLLCDGSSVLRATYPDLFAAIGTAYGSVDGTHFTLPNFVNRVPRGNTRVASGGSDSHGHTGNPTSLDSAGTPSGGTFFESTNHTHGISSGSAASVANHNHGSPTGPGGGANGGTPSGTVNVNGTGTQAVAGQNHTHPGTSHDHSIGSDGGHGHSLTGSTSSESTAHAHALSADPLAAHQHSTSVGSGSNVPGYVGLLFIIKV